MGSPQILATRLLSSVTAHFQAADQYVYATPNCLSDTRHRTVGRTGRREGSNLQDTGGEERRVLGAKEARELAFDNAVALTGCRFQTRAIEDGDPATPVTDQPRPLQCAGRLTGAAAIYAQHLRQ